MTLAALAALVALVAAAGVVQSAPSQHLALHDVLGDLSRADPLALVAGAPQPPVHRKRRLDPALLASSVGDDGDSVVLGSPDDPWRLPRNITPVSYELLLKPMMYERFLFHGSVDITINVLEDSSLVVMHAHTLHIPIDSIDLYLAEIPAVVVATAQDIEIDDKHEMIGIDFGMTLLAGERYKMVFKGFDGTLNDLETGFYRSSYKIDNEVRWLATTQFESTGARMAFPCFDEPSFKARFTVSILHDPKHSVVANMPLSTTETMKDGWIKDTFQTSLPMSTYLVAFVVSDFDFIGNPVSNVKTHAREQLISGAVEAEDVAPKSLQLEADWTGIPYALPKMDQAAIPDFAAGAMENWGLVTYREPYMIQMADSTTATLEMIPIVICHELGHQWTGDLVTLDWWSHTWLNEGFATYFETYICAQIKPEWNLVQKFPSQKTFVGMDKDAIDTQHAMSYAVHTPDEAENIFDRISYYKAGAVLRMFENALTPAVFRAGVHRYLVVSSFQNTNPNNLFRALNAEAHKAGVLSDDLDFEAIASSWSEQPGVPVVNVTRLLSTGTVTFSQERFFYSDPYAPSLRDQRWWIPITYFLKSKANWNNTAPNIWLRPDLQFLSVPLDDGMEETDWLIVNPSATAYYRVNYDEANWKLLSDALAANPSDFTPETRSQLINDSLSLARASMVQYETALQLTTFLSKETMVAPWIAAVSSLSFLKDRVANTDAFGSFQLYVQALTSNAFQSLGFKVRAADTHEQLLLRYYVAPWACDSGVSGCQSAAAALLNEWLADSTTSVHPDILSPTLCYGVRGGDSTTFNNMKSKWLAETDATKRFTYLSALACSSDQTLLTGLLSDALGGSLNGASSADVKSIFNAYLNRPESRMLVANYVMLNVGAINTYFNDQSVSLSIVQRLIAGIRSRSEFYNMRVWIENHFKGTSQYDTLQQSLISSDEDLAWFDNHYQSVSSWLSSNYNQGSVTNPPTSWSSVTPSGGSTPKSNAATSMHAALAVSYSSFAALLLALAAFRH